MLSKFPSYPMWALTPGTISKQFRILLVRVFLFPHVGPFLYSYLDHFRISATRPTFNTYSNPWLLASMLWIRSLTPTACSCSGLVAQSVEQQWLRPEGHGPHVGPFPFLRCTHSLKVIDPCVYSNGHFTSFSSSFWTRVQSGTKSTKAKSIKTLGTFRF